MTKGLQSLSHQSVDMRVSIATHLVNLYSSLYPSTAETVVYRSDQAPRIRTQLANCKYLARNFTLSSSPLLTGRANGDFECLRILCKSEKDCSLTCAAGKGHKS